MSFSDLPSFLAALESRGDLARVAEPVDPVLEATALARRVQAGNGPALLIEQPTGSRVPLLLNLFGHRRRIEAVLSRRPVTSLRELGGLLARLNQPRVPRTLPATTGPGTCWPKARTSIWTCCRSSNAGPRMPAG